MHNSLLLRVFPDSTILHTFVSPTLNIPCVIAFLPTKLFTKFVINFLFGCKWILSVHLFTCAKYAVLFAYLKHFWFMLFFSLLWLHLFLEILAYVPTTSKANPKTRRNKMNNYFTWDEIPKWKKKTSGTNHSKWNIKPMAKNWCYLNNLCKFEIVLRSRAKRKIE